MPPTSRAAPGPRPTGTDGSDFKHRQTIENKYQVLPLKRKKARSAASSFALLAGLRTVWSAALPFAAGAPLPPATLALAAAATAAAATGVAGFAGGRAHKERAGALAAYPIVVVAAVAVLLVTAYLDHTATPPAHRRPALAAALAGPRAEGSASVVDALMDGVAAGTGLAAAAAVRAYTAAKAAKK